MEFLLATDSSSRRLALSNSCITFDFTQRKWSAGKADIRCWMLDVGKNRQLVLIG
jgi:hypothetical protein